jgi:hypothetical protein
LFDQRWAGRACIEQLRRSTNPIDLNATLGDDKPSIAIGDGKMLAPRVASHNKIPLKFGTKELVAEYFHYAGDLFLVHKSAARAPVSRSMYHPANIGTIHSGLNPVNVTGADGHSLAER